MISNRPEIMGAPVDTVTMETALEKINNCVVNQEKLHIITINAEMIMLTKTDPEFFEILKKAGLLIPDGSGVVWALRKQGIKVKKLAGVELSQKCVTDLPHKIFLFGTSEEVIKTAYEKLKALNGKSELVGYRNGFFKEEDNESIIKQINDSGADIVFIGLGVPKQEKWIKNNMSKINASVFVGVGGSFDVFSGKIKRAPMFMRKLHLEWLYRLYLEPWRWKRMLVLPKFVAAVYMEKK